MIGSSTGRNQLVPWVSPNKTVEGLLGGCLCAVLIIVILHFGGLSPWDDSFGNSLLLGLVVAVTAPLGDLMASMFKRNLEVKDFGTLLPGHGGVLDRFCSFLFVLPAVYYLCRVLGVF